MSSTPTPDSPPSKTQSEDTEKWGTHVMGQPAIPTKHPDNQKAALWNAGDHQQFHHEQSPYLVYSPVEKPVTNPLEPVINLFNTWTNKADSIARNIWHNLKTGSSVTGAAWGKVNLTAKAITEGGFESIDRPLCFTAPSGQETWSYYKVVIPLGNIGTVNPVTMREKENPSERYIQIVTVDGHDFWFMGFVNYDKASRHIMNSLSEFNAKVAASSDVHVA
ncbi:GEM-like protein 5 [Tanacetum coccineum]